MNNSVLGLSIDYADAAKLAQFWADVLGREVNPQPTAEFAAIDANDSTQGPDWRSIRSPRPRLSKIGCT